MRSIVRSLPLALVVLLFPGRVLAQGLGDAAARERQKREVTARREKPRVLTNEDLPKPDASRPSAPVEASTAEASSPLSGDRDRRGDEDQAKTELEKAQARVEEARAAVVAAEERVKALGDKLNPMSTSFIYGGASQGDLVAEEMRTRERSCYGRSGALRRPGCWRPGRGGSAVRLGNACEDAAPGSRTEPMTPAASSAGREAEQGPGQARADRRVAGEAAEADRSSGGEMMTEVPE